jgi:hypothetical protein
MGQIARWPTPERQSEAHPDRIAAQAGVRTSTAGQPPPRRGAEPWAANGEGAVEASGLRQWRKNTSLFTKFPSVASEVTISPVQIKTSC